MSESRPPSTIGGDGGVEALERHVDEALRLGVDRPHAGGEGGVAVPAVDDRPAVDRDDVALLEDHVGRRDAVDDHVVGRGADDAGNGGLP